MGGSLQRIEVLLIGLALLIAGAAVVLLTVVRALVPPGDVRAAPPTVVTFSAPTAAPVVTKSPPTTTPSTPIVPAATAAVVAAPGGRPGGASVPALPRPLWSLLLLVIGCLGLPLAVLRARRRRMRYTRQSIGQLLATADAATRATNVRVMRDLAEQGVLTADLASAAGIDLRRATQRRWLVQLPRFRWPRMDVPTVRLPRLRIPPLAWSRWRLIRRWRMVLQAHREARLSLMPIAPEAAAIEPPLFSDSSLGAMDRPGGIASEPAGASADMAMALPWTAEDRVLAIANVLAELWAELRLPSLLTARRPAWRATWRRNMLEVTVTVDGAPPIGGPLLAPVLTHGRGGVLTRFLPLTSWPHLGIYGSAALGALHTILGSLLYAQSRLPSAIRLRTC